MTGQFPDDAEISPESEDWVSIPVNLEARRPIDEASMEYMKSFIGSTLVFSAQKFIVNLLNERGMSETDLAEKMGVPLGRVSIILRGVDIDLKLGTIGHVLAAIDIPPPELSHPMIEVPMPDPDDSWHGSID